MLTDTVSKDPIPSIEALFLVFEGCLVFVKGFPEQQNKR